MFFSAKATLVLLFSFASFTIADPPGLTGTAPGSNPADVKHEAVNDPSYIDDTNFQKSMIDTHNKWRGEHGVLDVSWDPRLAVFAATVSQKCDWKHSVCDAVNSYILLILRVPSAWGVRELMVYAYRAVRTGKTYPLVSRLHSFP